ncbi:AraC family transcriptional regulator [Rheinheimera faecalis]|uniref:AraC family transcriptional regulator n=1 Tax=Rheinheimera faecalis TaxID=2901141 RepID=UPI001E4EE14A|nr:AraC family transcriptional regulator [Rheinheimera faecalis]
MDPLTEVISLLQPRTVFSKGISGAGAWAVRYSDFGFPSFCAVLEGGCLLAVDGQDPVTLQAGDFILLPTTPGFTMSGFDKVTPQLIDSKAAALATGEIRHGRTEGPADVRLLGGYFEFNSPDSALLVSLMPGIVHLRQSKSLPVLVSLINDECQSVLAGQDLVLSRLVEVLLIEALRSTATEHAPPGLLRGLADERVALAIREIHRDPARSWTVAAMAQLSALSRTAFFQRFSHTVGVLPMEYLLRWRMALAKDLLRRLDLGLTEVADRTGYQSASAFSTAFSRYTGQSPSSYAKENRLVKTQ